MSTWTYYAVFQPPFSTAEQPDTVLRQRPGSLREDAERLSQNGTWRPSDLLELIYLGHLDTEVEKIDRARAVEIARLLAESGAILAVPADL